jgi:hypothetical protein
MSRLRSWVRDFVLHHCRPSPAGTSRLPTRVTSHHEHTIEVAMVPCIQKIHSHAPNTKEHIHWQLCGEFRSPPRYPKLPSQLITTSSSSSHILSKCHRQTCYISHSLLVPTFDAYTFPYFLSSDLFNVSSYTHLSYSHSHSKSHQFRILFEIDF